MKMILTVAALDDLRSIRKYTFETWGKQQEELYLGRIWQRFETIRAAPTRYRQYHTISQTICKNSPCHRGWPG
jgi:plasmid stabilization system protein ParE